MRIRIINRRLINMGYIFWLFTHSVSNEVSSGENEYMEIGFFFWFLYEKCNKKGNQCANSRKRHNIFFPGSISNSLWKKSKPTCMVILSARINPISWISFSKALLERRGKGTFELNTLKTSNHGSYSFLTDHVHHLYDNFDILYV